MHFLFFLHPLNTQTIGALPKQTINIECLDRQKDSDFEVESKTLDHKCLSIKVNTIV